MKHPDLVHEVVELLARADGVEPHELPYALHDHVDTTTLAGLDEMDGVEWRVAFEVPGHDVEVYSDGRIVVDGSAVEEGSSTEEGSAVDAPED